MNNNQYHYPPPPARSAAAASYTPDNLQPSSRTPISVAPQHPPLPPTALSHTQSAPAAVQPRSAAGQSGLAQQYGHPAYSQSSSVHSPPQQVHPTVYPPPPGHNVQPMMAAPPPSAPPVLGHGPTHKSPVARGAPAPYQSRYLPPSNHVTSPPPPVPQPIDLNAVNSTANPVKPSAHAPNPSRLDNATAEDLKVKPGDTATEAEEKKTQSTWRAMREEPDGGLEDNVELGLEFLGKLARTL